MTEFFPSFSATKNFTYVAAFIASVEWLGLTPGSVSVFAALMVIDVITGIARAAVVSGAQSIRSAVLKRGLLAKLLVLTALFSVALTGKGLGFDIGPLVQASVNVLILGELYSVLGNIHSARTGNQKIEFDAVAFLLARVRELIKKALK